MKFNEETFLIENVSTSDSLENYYEDKKELLEKVGFKKILNNLNKSEKKEDIIPFKQLIKKEARIIQFAYNYKWSVDDFNSLIPLKTLSLLALCKEKKYFDEVSIRSDLDNQNPLLSSFIAIGKSKNEESYLIARWSVTPLEKIEDLESKAKYTVKKKLLLKINKDLQKANQDLEDIDNLTLNYLEGGYISYYIY